MPSRCLEQPDRWCAVGGCHCERCERARAQNRASNARRRKKPGWNKRQRDYYHNQSGVQFNRLLLRHRRNKALARMKLRNQPRDGEDVRSMDE